MQRSVPKTDGAAFGSALDVGPGVLRCHPALDVSPGTSPSSRAPLLSVLGRTVGWRGHMFEQYERGDSPGFGLSTLGPRLTRQAHSRQHRKAVFGVGEQRRPSFRV